jgi:uncharacterized protein
VLVVDANVLLYAVNRDSAHHRAAHAWLDGALAEGEGVGFAWTVLLAFLRLSTSRAIFAEPLSDADAVQCVEGWLAQPAAVVVSPTPRHLGILAGLLRDAGTAANLVNDAHLAALAVEHGASIASFDRDFRRFEGVRLLVPG